MICRTRSNALAVKEIFQNKITMIRANVDVTIKGPASFSELLLTPLKLEAEPVNLFD